MALGLHEPRTPIKAMAGQEALLRHQPPRLLILFDSGHEEVVHLIADVLGYFCLIVDNLQGAKGSLGELQGGVRGTRVAMGIEKGRAKDLDALKRAGWVVVMTRDADEKRDEELMQVCDFEHLYSLKESKSTRRTVAQPQLHNATIANQMKCNLNSRLSRPAGDLFIVTNANGPNSIDSFFQKLLNELSLRHNLHSVHTSQLAQLLALPTFGGCSMQPPVRATSLTYKIPALTPAAAAIGLVDTISAHSTSKNSSARNLVADNLAWRAICDTLTQNLDPSAYTDRTAIVLANEESGAAAAMYALGRLGIRAVYTIGFEARKGCISENVATKRIEDLDGLRRMREEEEPFVVVNALPAGRGKAAVAVLQLLAEAFSSAHDEVEQRTASVFLDLTATPAAIEGGHKTGEPCEVAGHLGWKVYDEMDVKCRFATATFQELCGHRVPVKFGRRYGGLGARY